MENRKPMQIGNIHYILVAVLSLFTTLLPICLYELAYWFSHGEWKIPPQAIVLCICLYVIQTLSLSLVLHSAQTKLRVQAIQIAENEKKLAEAAGERMRANLLRAVSHDLRTPLTGIIGNCMAYLENGSLLQQDEKDDLVRYIYDDSTWLINMVENLLTITRIKGEGFAITTSMESVEEVVGEALGKMQKRHPDCMIHAVIPDELIFLPMDAILIEQVTINLLENALFHSGSSAPIDLMVENGKDCVSFTIKDYGNGIPKEKLSSLFDGSDYHFSADAKKGMGIGLLICHTIITAHHGTITGSNHEHGAQFTFVLPKKEACENECQN